MRTIPLHTADAPWPSPHDDHECYTRAPDHEARINALAEQVQAYLGQPGQRSVGRTGKGVSVSLTRLKDGREFHFDTMTDACAFVKMNMTTVYQRLKDSQIVAGYRWRKQATPGVNRGSV